MEGRVAVGSVGEHILGDAALHGVVGVIKDVFVAVDDRAGVT